MKFLKFALPFGKHQKVKTRPKGRGLNKKK
jgi:cytochrome c oxidase subunit 1